MAAVQVCLCLCVCICLQDSSRSQFYEWKGGICHFFTIFGHSAVQRESFVYAAKNKMWQWSPQAETVPHFLQVKFTACLKQSLTNLWLIAANLGPSVQSFCPQLAEMTEAAAMHRILAVVHPSWGCPHREEDVVMLTLRFLAMTKGFICEAPASQVQLCVCNDTGLNSYDHQEAMKWQGPSEG